MVEEILLDFFVHRLGPPVRMRLVNRETVLSSALRARDNRGSAAVVNPELRLRQTACSRVIARNRRMSW
jgi:hypothetical protein